MKPMATDAADFQRSELPIFTLPVIFCQCAMCGGKGPSQT